MLPRTTWIALYKLASSRLILATNTNLYPSISNGGRKAGMSLTHSSPSTEGITTGLSLYVQRNIRWSTQLWFCMRSSMFHRFVNALQIGGQLYLKAQPKLNPQRMDQVAV